LWPQNDIVADVYHKHIAISTPCFVHVRCGVERRALRQPDVGCAGRRQQTKQLGDIIRAHFASWFVVYASSALALVRWSHRLLERMPDGSDNERTGWRTCLRCTGHLHNAFQAISCMHRALNKSGTCVVRSWSCRAREHVTLFTQRVRRAHNSRRFKPLRSLQLNALSQPVNLAPYTGDSQPAPCSDRGALVGACVHFAVMDAGAAELRQRHERSHIESQMSLRRT
jgi:hypothetical protein